MATGTVSLASLRVALAQAFLEAFEREGPEIKSFSWLGSNQGTTATQVPAKAA
jgi:hypothetical protein